MIKGDKEYLDQLAGAHHCPEHPDQALTVAWLTTGEYVIRCGAGHYPEEITRTRSLTEQFKIGEPLPAPIADNVVKGAQNRAQKSEASAPATVLGQLPSRDLSTGEILSPAQVAALVDYALKYGLDPYRGHVVMMYGQPYIGLDGYLYHAKQAGESYSLISRPLNSDERINYMIGENDHAWISTVRITSTGAEFTGLGIVTAEELTEESKNKPGQKRYPVVAKYPWQLAQKRADWQAMRRAFPIGESPEEVNNAD